MAVMEGKAILFKKLADIDAFPICLATQDDQCRALTPITDPRAMTRAIAEVLSDERYYRDLCQNARRRAESRCDEVSLLDGFEDLFTTAINVRTR